MSVWVLVCVDARLHLCLFGCRLNEGTGRFVRGKLVYWPPNRLNEEESGRGQGAGKSDSMEAQEEKGIP